jgi:hypothetical protein
MKRILFIFLLFLVAGCYTPRTGYIDYKDRRMYDWDPIYYIPGYIDPFFYRREPIIIYRDRYIHTPRQPQQPRNNGLGPTAPPHTPIVPRTAPIREFPKKDKR